MIWAIEIGGWVGTALVVGAYFVSSRGILSAKSTWYQLMNLFGALLVGANVFYHGS